MMLLAALLAASPALPPAIPGRCGWVRGRFAIYNGSSLRRIWVIGTTRIVALYDDDDGMPKRITRMMETGDFKPGQSFLFGDFLVCARDRRIAGHMQHVRLRAARNLILVK